MKRTLALAGLLCLTLSSIQLSVQASDWFGRYDHNHDNHWDYNEFRNAHHDWARHHRNEAVVSDVELRSQFNGWDTGHRGYVERGDVQAFHHW
jgi:hypothetical protein